MRRSGPPHVVAWAAVLVLSGCILPRFQALERDVNELKLEASPPGETARVSERLADLGEEVSQLRSELGSLRGELEAVRHTAEQERRRTARRPEVAAVAPRDTGASPLGGSPEISEAGGGATPLSSPALTADSGGASSEIRDYEDAFRLYRAGDYRRAIDQFESFLQTHASSDYADNALFWLGECHFKLGDHERAVLVFEDVVKRYPNGNKVPDALYRQGRALLEIGARSQQAAAYRPAARQVFQRIVAEHPDSDRVREAQRELERLGP